MFLDHPIPPVSEKERAVSENSTRRRFETPSGVPCQSLEKPHSMVQRSYCEIDKHHRVARVRVATPRTICRQLLERGRNFVGISSDVELHRFQNSGNRIAHVSSHDVTTRIRDSLAPLADISRSKRFPVLLENAYTSFTLVDLFSLTKGQWYLHKAPYNLPPVFNQVNF